MGLLFVVGKNMDKNQTQLVVKKHDYNVPENHIARFVVEFVEENYQSLGIEEEIKKNCRPSYDSCSMLKLIIYAKIEHIESARIIEDMAKYHDIYKYVCDRIQPSERSIQRYRNKFGPYYETLLQKTLKKARDEEFTDFNHVSLDGTIKKAHNSNYNMISKKETKTLLQYYKGQSLDPEKLEKLHNPAKKILNDKQLSDEEKLELLYDIETQLTFAGTDKIPMNDIEARMMKGKKGNYFVAYNVQSAVDYDTKLICAVNIAQSPTDHYQLPDIADKAIKNIGKVPKHMSADTIYLNQISLSYFADKKIDGLIPTRKQSKEKIGKLNPNPYHKDHFTYIEELDAFMCPAKQILYFYREYRTPNENPDKPDTIKRLYNNYSACKTCVEQMGCFTGKQNHRIITENGDRMQRAMYLKMEKQEYKDEYSKRPCVEGPFGILKEQYHIEQEVVIGMTQTEERINLDALAYNLKRLYNIKQNKKNNKEDLIDFCESTATTHQLELNVNIF